jgi:AcrR family transcriptional regulator
MPSSTKTPGRRGRPPSYDKDTALGAIRDVFWSRGFSAASLDDIAAATGMNRPSLYGAFGDKREMYLAALRLFSQELNLEMQKALEAPTLREALESFYVRAIQEYVSGGANPRGCLILCTAATEAAGDPTIKAVLATALAEIDSSVAARIARAQAEHDRCIHSDSELLAKLVAGVLHSIAVRARAGTRRRELLSIAQAAVDLVVGPDRVAKASHR